MNTAIVSVWNIYFPINSHVIIQMFGIKSQITGAKRRTKILTFKIQLLLVFILLICENIDT